jgi:hypothetical protein
MYGAMLGIVMSVGGWLAWRRHPVYSQTATWRVFGEVLLLIIASICIIAVTVNLIQGRPFAVQAGALLGVIVCVTLGMIFAITAITTPKSALLNTVLPADVPVINLRRRGVVHWLRVTAVFTALCAAACALPGNARYIAATVLLMDVLIASILLPTAWFMARRFDRAATALTLHPWLHWRYSPEEWQAWSAIRVERLAAQPAAFELERDWRRVLLISGAILSGSFIFMTGSWGLRIGWAALCIALVLGVVEFAAWHARRAPDKLRTLLKRVAPDVWFGDDGLLCDDRLMTWLGADVYLASAALDERAPRSLSMKFEKIVPNPYGSPQTVEITQSVLIPAGAGAGDLLALRKALAERCPRATLSF